MPRWIAEPRGDGEEENQPDIGRKKKEEEGPYLTQEGKKRVRAAPSSPKGNAAPECEKASPPSLVRRKGKIGFFKSRKSDIRKDFPAGKSRRKGGSSFRALGEGKDLRLNGVAG